MDNEQGSELAQKRERGRMAQRAFRQRQINTIRELKGKNQELADVIEKITQTAARFSRIDNPSAHDRASLDTAIQEARSLAGLPPLGPGDGDGTHIQAGGNLWPVPSNNTLETSDLLISATGVESNDISSRGSSPSMTGSVEDMIFAQDFTNRTAQNEANNQLLASTCRQYNSATDSYFTSQQTSTTTTVTATGGRVSPRLTYGVWFEPDRFIRIINPPGDIVPYLGSNINTLAGAIFWAGLGYGFTVLKEVLRMRANSNLVRSMSMSHNNPGERSSSLSTLPLVTRLFGHSIEAAGPDADGEQILHDIIHARFTWRKQGYIPGDHPGADPEIANKLFRKVVENMTAVPFPTPTSKISIRNNKANSRNSGRNSPDMITNRQVEDLDDLTANPRGNNPTITTKANESTPSDRDLANWLTPAEIEAYVEARLNAPIPTTSPETSTFGGAPAPTSTSNTSASPSSSGPGSINYSSFESAFQARTHSHNHNDQHIRSDTAHRQQQRIRASMLKRLVRTLSDKGACFGNSPRWRIDVVSQAVDTWMAEVESAERAAAAAMDHGHLSGLFGPGFGYGAGFAAAAAGNEPFPSGWDTSRTSGFAATTTTGAGMAESQSTNITTNTGAPQWYIPGPGFGFRAPQEYGYDYQYGHGHGHELGVMSSTSTAAPTSAATTAASTAHVAAYGGDGSSSSSWYGSDSEGVGKGIPEGMVV